VFRAAEETETTQENILRFKLDGDPGFQLPTEEETAAVMYFFFHQHYLYN
jgi:hypothetical protein